MSDLFDLPENREILGGLVMRQTTIAWVVLVGLDEISIPKSASELCKDDKGRPFLMVSKRLLSEEKGIEKGLFYNTTPEERAERAARRRAYYG